jgi:hypothetical protein
MLNITEHIERANNGDVDSMLYLGDYYRKNKEYDKMIKFYLFAIEVGNSIIAKEKLEKYFEFVKNDYDQALIFYQKISYKNHHTQRIEEKCSTLVEFGTDNKIILNKKCHLCCEKNVDIFRLDTCCKKKICIKCVSGIINKRADFTCPFCRKNYYFDNNKDLLYTDSDIDDHEYESHFIGGIYYEDE